MTGASIETGWGNLIPDPMGAGAYAPGYGEWYAEQCSRDWFAWRRDRRYGRLTSSAREVADLIRRLEWYRTAAPGWHLARLIRPTEADLAVALRRHAELVATYGPADLEEDSGA